MLDYNGFTPLEYDDALALTRQQIQSKLGQDIDVSDASPFGLIAQLWAQQMVEQDQDLQDAYDAGFVNSATGVSLDRLAGNFGITRNDSASALVQVQFKGTPGYVIDAGPDNLLITDAGDEFELEDDVQLDTAGNGTGTAFSEVEGADQNIDANTLTSLESPVDDVTYVNNDDPAEGGADLENDYDFRKRILKNMLSSDSATPNGIITAVSNVTGVNDVKILENLTDNTDSNGNPPHSIHIYVNGGATKDVATAIFNSAAAGVLTVGDQVSTLDDDGGTPHEVRFDYVSQVPIYVSVAVTTNNDYDNSNDNESIYDAIVEYLTSLGTGETVNVTKLYQYIYDIDGVTDISEIKIGTDRNKLAFVNVDLTPYQIATSDNGLIALSVNGGDYSHQIPSLQKSKPTTDTTATFTLK